MSGRRDSQEVGLEAAILQRVRNSSLVEWPGADNVAGLKCAAEAAGLTLVLGLPHPGVVQARGSVGERRTAGEAAG